MAAIDNFRTNLRHAMKILEISQRDLAKHAQTGYPYLNRILKGKADPSLPMCDRLAEATGYTLECLIQSPSEFQQATRMSRRMRNSSVISIS